MPLTRNSFRGKKPPKRTEENDVLVAATLAAAEAAAADKNAAAASKRRPRAPSGSNGENDKKNVKRTALGELTNNIVKTASQFGGAVKRGAILHHNNNSNTLKADIDKVNKQINNNHLSIRNINVLQENVDSVGKIAQTIKSSTDQRRKGLTTTTTTLAQQQQQNILNENSTVKTASKKKQTNVLGAILGTKGAKKPSKNSGSKAAVLSQALDVNAASATATASATTTSVATARLESTASSPALLYLEEFDDSVSVEERPFQLHPDHSQNPDPHPGQSERLLRICQQHHRHLHPQQTHEQQFQEEDEKENSKPTKVALDLKKSAGGDANDCSSSSNNNSAEISDLSASILIDDSLEIKSLDESSEWKNASLIEESEQQQQQQQHQKQRSLKEKDFLRSSPLKKVKSPRKTGGKDKSSEADLDESVIDVVEVVENPEDDLPDIDKENAHDPFQSPIYAQDIFQYYKSRESKFSIEPYISRQPDLTSQMRAVLVDWLVEVQENFELNHETLYLAVKLTDLYLERHLVSKEALQLVGATSLFIASKFDERCPPCCDDFLYICDDAYTKKEFVQMERNVLRSVDYQLGLPLSYRFLRRYGKVANVSMETLTLSRFILEMSLMDYSLLQEKESKIAAATLLLAMRLKKVGPWTAILSFHSGYSASDLTPLLTRFNAYLDKNSFYHSLTTIRSKYGHQVFFEVANVEPLSETQLEQQQQLTA